MKAIYRGDDLGYDVYIDGIIYVTGESKENACKIYKLFKNGDFAKLRTYSY